MSQAGRKAHSIHKAQHAQRVFGTEKAKLEPVGSDTLWLGEFLSSAQGIDWLSADSLICYQLGTTHEEREAKLRKASSMGVLLMYVHRDAAGAFIEYRWMLTPLGTFSR